MKLLFTFKQAAILGFLFFAELVSGAFLNINAVRPPLFPSAVIVLFWNMRTESRLWLALLAGFLLDTVSPVPFGTYVAALICAACATQLWRKIFSHTESLFSQGLGAALSLAVFFGAALFFSLFLDNFKLDAPVLGGYGRIAEIALAGLLWSAMLPFLFFFLKYLLQKFFLGKL